MAVYRTWHNEKLYKEYQAHSTGVCDFCVIKEGNPQFVIATESFNVIHNRFPYAFWDDQDVVDHLLVVPKEHVDSLAAFTPGQAAEYLALVSDYENNGYHVYARGAKSQSRSIVHQHTHLIKGAGRSKRLVLQSTRPYILYTK
jgi:diadenosine tetraphosphate (Ap4A) HIT family hydrolase